MGYNVAVCGATGNVGREMLNILAERLFPVDQLTVLASRRSLGTECSFGDKTLKTKDLDTFVIKIYKTSIPQFPIKGNYLLKQGFKEGPELGKVLKTLENIWINNNFDISDKDVQNLIKNLKNN